MPVRRQLELLRETSFVDATHSEGTSTTWNVKKREEDIRIYAWLRERLARVHYERYGLWPRLRRFFFGDSLAHS
jgi:hypothetical protein